MNIHFLHGFLGLPTDWQFLKEKFPKFNCHLHSIEDYIENHKSNHFSCWAKNFNNSIFKNTNVLNQTLNKKNILVGYSLGGRLALHSLIESNKWDGVMIISAHPGLLSENEKKLRLTHDMNWAKRFLEEPWESLMKDWNSQGVFSGLECSLQRKENLYDRKILSHFLTSFSLGNQKNLRPFLKELNIPFLWIAGEFDKKFTQIAFEMSSLNKNINHQIIPQIGHRVPWEASEVFINILDQFLCCILQKSIA